VSRILRTISTKMIHITPMRVNVDALTYNQVTTIKQMMIDNENGMYLKVNDAMAVVPEYRQKS